MMQLGNQHASSNAENRRDFGLIMSGLIIAGIAIVVIAHFLGIPAGDVWNIVARVGGRH
jgi:hypothetical protein